MCGFAGFLDPSATLNWERPDDILVAMGNSLVHRGPDDAGVWIDASSRVGFVHRRLSILDLSPAGHQPMVSHSGRYVIVLNGEIYNHRTLRQMLERGGIREWRGHSDTETVLEAIAAWGLDRALEQVVGMFAFALWDGSERCLYLARDRFGEKPLYYGWQRDVFVFGSELKALRAHPAFEGQIDRSALTLFLRYGYIPAPRSIYEHVQKLPVGTWLRVQPTLGAPLSPIAYWSLRRVVERAMVQPFRGGDVDALNELERRLGEAVSLQRVADVPLGAFLSGGIDSSLVVALMQSQSSRPVRTFTVGFHEAAFNEAAYAKAVAHHLGTQHTELYVSPQEAREVIPLLPALYDEPFADSSQIPTFLIARLARAHVTVALSGDGGDELFGGYVRYVWARRIWRNLRAMPDPIRRVTASLLRGISPAKWDVLVGALSRCLPEQRRLTRPGEKAHKLAELLTLSGPEAFHHGLVSQWRTPSDLVVGGGEPKTALTDPLLHLDLPEFEHRMMYLDALTYLTDDILVKVDRAAMSVSLETRVPMLDHRVVEYAWQLPLRMKVRHGVGKWLLRELLCKFVPKHLIDRPKMGFSIPLDEWLRGPLRDWAASLLDESRLRRQGFLKPALIRRHWDEHQAGQRNGQGPLWNVLMFQAWIDSVAK